MNDLNVNVKGLTKFMGVLYLPVLVTACFSLALSSFALYQMFLTYDADKLISDYLSVTPGVRIEVKCYLIVEYFIKVAVVLYLLSGGKYAVKLLSIILIPKGEFIDGVFSILTKLAGLYLFLDSFFSLLRQINLTIGVNCNVISEPLLDGLLISYFAILLKCIIAIYLMFYGKLITKFCSSNLKEKG